MAELRPAAVIVERACKHYGKPNKPDYKPVLKYLNMTVEKGIIYGLLGPSGCGKTTLLSSIVGRKKLDSGDIWVLGGKPGEKGSGVPGRRVGYMPQDIALVGEFSVRDAVYYFGRIYGMDNQNLSDRFDFLSNLLDLPGGGRFVKNLSGGQQRRVSLAAALVHEPELLILDEPTVGLDPVLRERIWEFLAEQARGGTTVIITTHYIDETKQAHKIGLLRDGQLLAEESPEQILRKFDCDTLEDAFLKLALRQHGVTSPSRSTLTSSPDVIPENIVTVADESKSSSREDFTVCTSSTDVLTKNDNKHSSGKSKDRYRAVFIKCLQQFARHPGGLIFAVIFPIIQVVAFFSAVGHNPRDLHLAVVNEEAALSPYGVNICSNSSLKPVTKLEDETCDLYMLSCWFLDAMEDNNIYQTPYKSLDDAKDSVRIGKLYGALYISKNFSDATRRRLHDEDLNDGIVDDSSISVWLDMTNHQISLYLKQQLYKAYKTFAGRSMKACDKPEKMVQMPVRFNDPVFGKQDAQFVSFMAPGIMITINFFLSAVITATLMISDRLEGVWERSAVAGVKPHEMLNVHIAIQSTVILLQTLELMVVAFIGYDLPYRGPILTIGLLLFLQGLSGMCYGFLLSVVCSSFTMSFFVATGSFYPMILLCGILWPLEGMSTVLRAIAFTLPFTIPSASLRDIMEKGSTITEPSVYQGFLVTLTWICITLALCFISLRFMKKYT